MASVISLILTNFSLAMFVLAVVLILLHMIMRPKLSRYEIAYRWLAVFAVGFTGFYAFIMHVFFPETAAAAIGWQPSPFQFEVGIADLTVGLLGLFSFKAKYNFRLAAVFAVTFWLWGDAVGHIDQMIQNQNFAVGNAGSWFWLDVIIPICLIVCLRHLKPFKPMVRFR